MRTFGRFLGRTLILLLLVAAGLWVFGPYEAVSVTPTVVGTDVGDDVDAHFEGREARFDDITEGVKKRVIWAQGRGEKTELAVVYVHGFSATSEEIRPVPDLVAEDLGANLVFTRLAGHGRDGAALAEATVQDWADDVAEALIVACKIADEVVVIATSTGATMVAAMADQSDVMQDVKGFVFVSPNFEIHAPSARLLTWPAARHWVPLLVGDALGFDPKNEGHATYWTTQYPTVAVMQMAALVAETKDQDFAEISLPAMFMFSDADTVVQPRVTREVAALWGGPVTLAPQILQEGSDSGGHVITGALISPAEVIGDVSEIINFIRGL